MKMTNTARNFGLGTHCWRRFFLGWVLMFCTFSSWATSVEGISADQQGANIIVKVTLSEAQNKLPVGFSIASPARIVLDFPGMDNATGKNTIEVGVSDLRSVNVVEAGGRTRLVFNLNRALNYAMAIEGKAVILTIDSSGGAATAVLSNGLPANPAPVSANRLLIRDLDFRRGAEGVGRIVVDLPNNQVAVDVQQQGSKIIANLLKVGLPPSLRRRLDVTDFGSPVQTMTATQEGENVRLQIEARGLWEHSVYQSDTQLIIDVKPIKEDPSRLLQGTQGYRGEKISFNFQNIEVRAILQVIAEVSGFNIIASDSVTGSLTLKIKDVPWDQALDIVLQSKGLDMRRNGSVIWVAPKDEILTKERIELEQKSQIADLEPLKTEVFQLNYQKAESFKKVFNVDAASKNSILSKRGSAVIDERTNQLFVTDIPTKIEDIRKLVQKTDIASKQVLIEARIVEANDQFSKNLGVKLGFTDLRSQNGGTAGYGSSSSAVGVTGNYQGLGEQTGQLAVTNPLLAATTNTQFINLPASGINGVAPTSIAMSLFSAAANRFLNLELSALEADGNGKILSNPKVIAADQLKALVEQGTQIPYQVATSSGATSIQFVKATLRLEVTPQITPDGKVILDVEVHKDSVGAVTSGGLAIDTKLVKTMALVENGGTVMLGGIYQQTLSDSVNKVPVLGDLPVLGALFRNNAKRDDKTELLIFITPKIVNDKISMK